MLPKLTHLKKQQKIYIFESLQGKVGLDRFNRQNSPQCRYFRNISNLNS